jgi:glc operon protein GlcG
MTMKAWLRMIAVALTVVTMGVAVRADQLATKKTLTLAIAKQVAAASEAEATKNKWIQVIAILDDGGNLIYLERMDDSQLGSLDVALAKAKSALYFKRPTKAFQDQVAAGGNNILKLPNAIANEGGVPLMADGKVIGAIGISGATAQQDGQVAAAGVDALAKILAQ